MDLLNLIDVQVIYAIIMVFGIVLFLKYVKPKIQGNDDNYFDEIKLALMITKTTFRNDKIKIIADTAYGVVMAMEQLTLSNTEKHKEAVQEISKKLNEDLNINLSQEQLDIIIKVAVAFLPKTANA